MHGRIRYHENRGKQAFYSYRFALVILLFAITGACKKIEPVKIFKVETDNVSEVSGTIWSASGDVIDLGEGGITQHGFCYATHSDPTISNYEGIVQLGAVVSTGEYSENLSDLLPGRTYYVRAFLSNEDSATYGQVLNFGTLSSSSVPTVSTTAASSVSETTAFVGGNVSDEGGNAVTERGIYYGTSSNPQSTGTKVSIESENNIFATTLTGLTKGTKYFFIAYAANSSGTGYGSVQEFTTVETEGAPTVSTTAASSVGETTATVGGDVTDDGGASVTERGVYYSTSTNPQSTGTKVPIGDDTGVFSTTLSGLKDGTQYHFVAYATNSAATSFGTALNFTTSEAIVKPSVSTTAASSVGETTATVGGDVTDDGGASVTERGVYYSTSTNPQSTGIKVPVGDDIGVFSTTLTALTENERYYFLAYATNSAGTAFGNTLEFDTEESNTISDYENNTYEIVQIGSQWWMAENLKATKLDDGTPLNEITGDSEWGEATSAAYCWYDNDEGSNKDTYGALYNFYAVESGNLCPSGWHIPTDNDWKVLESYAGMDSGVLDDWSWRGTDQGTKLKANYMWGEGKNGTDDFGFTALPGGDRSSSGSFQYATIASFFWTSSEYATEKGIYRVLGGDQTNIERNHLSKSPGFSIRCIKD